jgi:xylose dehydrogenase (NAD/NADP)
MPDPNAPTAPVRLGLLSTARINRLVIPAARASPEVEVVAVASRSPRAAAAYAREWGIPTAHGSYEALLADDGVDAVYVSLPNALHVEWSIRALESGKHVLCEKPLARSPREVERAFDAAERTRCVLAEAFMWRHNPQAQRLKELVAGGAIGELQRVESEFGFTVDSPENVRLDPGLDGGALMDVGCYCVSGSRLLAGEPELVEGRQELGGGGVDVRFEGVLRFPDGVVATFLCGLELDPVDTLTVFGTSGSVFLDDPWHARDPVLVIRTEGGEREERLERVDSYRLELEDLVRAIRGDAEPLLGRDDALAQARAIDALYASAAVGGAPRRL